MILKENVVKEFAGKGVNVRWYLERTRAEFEKRFGKIVISHILTITKTT